MYDAQSFFEWWRSQGKGHYGEGSASTGPGSDWPPGVRQKSDIGESNQLSPRFEPDWLPRNPEEADLTGISDFDIEEELENDWEKTEEDIPTEEYGLDALAWYRPFHTAGAACGIYIRPVGICTYAKRLWACLEAARTETSVPLEFGGEIRIEESEFDQATLKRLALETLLQHEWFHYQVERIGFYIEDILNEFRYPEYSADVYWYHYAEKDCIEESLANAAAARSGRCAELLKNAYSATSHGSIPSWPTVLQYLVQNDPPAYREFGRFTRNTAFRQGCERLASQIVDAKPTSQPAPGTYLGEQLMFDRLPDIDKEIPELPIYIVTQ